MSTGKGFPVLASGQIYAVTLRTFPDRLEVTSSVREGVLKNLDRTLAKIVGRHRMSPTWHRYYYGAEAARAYVEIAEALNRPTDPAELEGLRTPRAMLLSAWCIAQPCTGGHQ